MITVEYLRSVLHYDPDTGIFTWLVMHKPGIGAGKIAGHNANGRITIQIDRKNYLAHRLAWLYMTGEWPEEMIDHKDTVSDNNKWENLREATNRQNQYNVTRRKENSTGVKGVYKSRNKFKATIKTIEGQKHLGVFDTVEEAALAYDKAAIELHGEFFNRLDP